MFLNFEKIDYCTRIDEKRLPTAFKCATVSNEELVALRKIKNIIRNGRIECLEKDKIVFKDERFVLAMYIFSDKQITTNVKNEDITFE